MLAAALTGIAVVLVVSVMVGTVRPRRYATVADFYVAARTVPPLRNGAAISSEFTSAAACLGLAGMIATHGPQMLWYPAGAAAGFVVLLALVVAPLRRSGAYTLPDFARWRLGSGAVRRMTTCVVLAVGVVYLVAQFHAAGLVVGLLTGLPEWAGWAAVAVPSVAVALAGGAGSVTSVQATQFWMKLAVFSGVALALWAAWHWGAVPDGPSRQAAPAPGPVRPEILAGAGDTSLPGVLAVLLACALGAMGLPHVVVRVYASPDGRGARRSLVAAQALLAVFFLLPPLYGLLGRIHVPHAHPDEVVLLLPSAMLPGPVGDLLTGLLGAGAFAAFLSTSCGTLASVAGAVSSCVTRASVESFRASVAGVAALTLAVCGATDHGGSVPLVLAAFSLSAATFCPMLVLGIWWRRLTDAGVAAGVVVGGGLTAGLVCADLVGVNLGLASACPAAFAVPPAFLAMVLMSLVTPDRVPPGVDAMMLRMHLPEDRSPR
ncbi:sodium:solute symporter family transporter [Thermoactinospora rubra]|uniref:sodium:solute symporter family transporter n=1 Tax=Thermoactinospora rubra TaxID=1088767 RepID=UPI000A10422D|nr:hypothetical protein [Thermoactinospora rubra]